ncbi:MAG: hemolysin III family protein [Pseudomonadota bacterium]|nr:MAG: hemolysin III family protein [Pseudomonadota bacterium]
MTHLLGAGVFFVLGITSLYRYRGAASRTVALSVFVTGVTFALAMSGVFHLLSHGTTGREVLQRLDHAAIFFLIAATFTPVHVMDFRGVSRWGILLAIWAAAIAGIVLKSIFFNDIPEWLSVTLYLGLGWAGALSAWLLFRRFGIEYIKPLIYGALAYTVGATMEFARFPVLVPQVIGPHELFHIMVLVGVAMHWWFVHRVARKAMA